MNRGTWCLAVWLLAGASSAAVDKLVVRVTPSVAIGPATVRIRTVAERDADNRAMEVVAESADFYRSSVVQLDGERAPRTRDFFFNDMPAGEYVIRAALFGSDGKERASVTRFILIN
jgi:hypothetical protein